MTVKQYCHTYDDIVHYAINLYEDNFINQEIRLIGIGISNVQIMEKISTQLFDDYRPKAATLAKDLDKIIETINGKMKLDILDIAKKKL